jgi:hypothetical protein
VLGFVLFKYDWGDSMDVRILQMMRDGKGFDWQSILISNLLEEPNYTFVAAARQRPQMYK